jgi:hypothetical protein
MVIRNYEFGSCGPQGGVMEFGIFSQMHCPEWDDENSRYHREIDTAILCDEQGFKYDWSPEHHFLQNYSHQPAPEVFLSFVAARTKQIHVGTAITNITAAVNHPARVAERIATMDHLSKGRVEFGTGRGSSSAEWGGFAIPSASETKPMWRESLEQIPRMWMDEPYEFEGKYFRMPKRNVLPKPYTRPHPPDVGRVLEPAHLHRGRRARPRRALLHVRHAERDRRARSQLQRGDQALQEADRRVRQRQHRRHDEHVLPPRRRRGAEALLRREGRLLHVVVLPLARLDPAPEGHAAGAGADQHSRRDARAAEGRLCRPVAARSARPRRSFRSSASTRRSGSTS